MTRPVWAAGSLDLTVHAATNDPGRIERKGTQSYQVAGTIRSFGKGSYDGVTVCGRQMLTEDLWVEKPIEAGDKVCRQCFPDEFWQVVADLEHESICGCKSEIDRCPHCGKVHDRRSMHPLQHHYEVVYDV